MIDGAFLIHLHLNPIDADNFIPRPNCRHMALHLYKSNAIHKKSRKAEAARDYFYSAVFALSRFCGKISIAVISEAGHGLLYR